MDALIKHIEEGNELSLREIYVATEMLLNEDVTDEKKAAFLRGLTAKGESAAEIAGFVEAFLERAVDPGVSEMNFSGPTIDVCGTGGDKLNLFNVSTTSMFVIAAGGDLKMSESTALYASVDYQLEDNGSQLGYSGGLRFLF